MFLAASLLLSISSFAEIVSFDKATEVAEKVLGTTSVNYVWNGSNDLKSSNSAPAFYVYTGNGRWAVISADDCATPVLMHGQGEFNPDNIPENMRALLKDIELNIIKARSSNFYTTPEIEAKWTAVSTDSSNALYAALETIVENEDHERTALWNQGETYNSSCPTFEGKPCYAGCSATAMAIIMRFFKWPETGKGRIEEYTTTTHKMTIPAIVLDGYKYDWSKMPVTDANTVGNWNEDQIKAVADLMYHCGAAVQMDYTPNGSGAVLSKMLDAMIRNMSYSASAMEYIRINFSNRQWFQMIKAEIDANRPFIYAGFDTKGAGGHAFVCDGYNSDNEIHINWGWGGEENAWYAVCYLGGNINYTFSSDDVAIFGLTPDKTGESQPITRLDVYSGVPGGISVTSGTVEKGSEFTIQISSIINSGYATFNGNVRAALFDKSGNIKEFISDKKEYNNLGRYQYYQISKAATKLTFNCKIKENLEVGDYISIVYSTEVPDKWKAVGRYEDGASSITQYPVFDITLLDIPYTFHTGEICYPNIMTRKIPNTIQWYVDGTELTAEYIRMTSGSHTFKVVLTYNDGTKETIIRKVTVK